MSADSFAEEVLDIDYRIAAGGASPSIENASPPSSPTKPTDPNPRGAHARIVATAETAGETIPTAPSPTMGSPPRPQAQGNHRDDHAPPPPPARCRNRPEQGGRRPRGPQHGPAPAPRPRHRTARVLEDFPDDPAADPARPAPSSPPPASARASRPRNRPGASKPPATRIDGPPLEGRPVRGVAPATSASQPREDRTAVPKGGKRRPRFRGAVTSREP